MNLDDQADGAIVKSGKLFLQRLLLLFVVIGSLVAVTRLVLAQVISSPPFDPIKAYAHLFKEGPRALGHLTGFQVSVPNNYVQYKMPFMVEYQDDTPWKARKTPIPERTLNSPIRSLTFYVQLPDFKPLTPEKYASWRASLEELISQEWIRASFTAGEKYADGTFDHFATRLNRILKGYQEGGFMYPHGRLKYKAEPDYVFGLTVEKPYPVDDTKEDRDNNHLYYRMEGGSVTTLIICGAGALSAPGGRHTCMHYYSLWPEAAIEGSFLYEPSMLPRWQELEDKAKALLFKFGVGCTADAPRCPPGFSHNSADTIKKGQ